MPSIFCNLIVFQSCHGLSNEGEKDSKKIVPTMLDENDRIIVI